MIVDSKLLDSFEGLKDPSKSLKREPDTKISEIANQKIENNSFNEKRDSTKIQSAKQIDQEEPNLWRSISLNNPDNSNIHQNQVLDVVELPKKFRNDREAGVREEKHIDHPSRKTYLFQNLIEKIVEYVQFFFNFLFKVSSEFIKWTAKCMIDVACFSFRLANELTIIKTFILNLNFARPSNQIQNQVVNHTVNNTVNRNVNEYHFHLSFFSFKRSFQI
jgi:hypothetical protein